MTLSKEIPEYNAYWIKSDFRKCICPENITMAFAFKLNIKPCIPLPLEQKMKHIKIVLTMLTILYFENMLVIIIAFSIN